MSAYVPMIMYWTPARLCYTVVYKTAVNVHYQLEKMPVASALLHLSLLHVLFFQVHCFLPCSQTQVMLSIAE